MFLPARYVSGPGLKWQEEGRNYMTDAGPKSLDRGESSTTDLDTPERMSAVSLAARAQKKRRRSGSVVLATQVALVVLLIAGMFALNASAGKLIMPKPTDVLDQSIKMWSDGTMWKGLRESL